MTRRVVSQGHFSKLAHVKQPSISEAVRKGRLHADAKGQVILDELAEGYIARNPGQRRRSRVDAAARPTQKNTPNRKHQHSHDDSKVGRSGESFTEAERRKMIAEANLKEQRVAKERGELVERTAVSLFMSRLYQIHTGQLRTLPERLGPDVAAAFNLPEGSIPKVQELVTADIQRSLTQIKLQLNEFLDSIGDGAVDEADSSNHRKPRDGRPKRPGRARKEKT